MHTTNAYAYNSVTLENNNKNQTVNWPPAFDALLGGFPSEYRNPVWREKN